MLFPTLVRSHLLTPPAVLLRFGASAATNRLVTRSFLTTARLAEPAKRATEATTESVATKTTKVKSAVKSAPKTKAAKTTKVAKPPAAEKPVKAKKVEKPQKIILTKEDKPPKRPPSTYFIFYTKFFKGQQRAEKEKPIEHAKNATLQASNAWKALNDFEKQPFKDEYAELLKEYHSKYAEYSARVPVDVLRELNARRAAKGKRKVKRTIPSDGRPISPFIRFIQDFRPEYMKGHSPEAGNKALATAKAAGAKWKLMSDAEKAKYVEPYHKELESWRASKGSQSA